MHVGLVAGETAWRPLLGRVAVATRAAPKFGQGALEPRLLRLEEGKLGLVVGSAFV